MTKRVGIQISPGDNVVTVVEETFAGETVRYATAQGPREIEALDNVPFGHKIALVDVPEGEAILKYDEVIGTASKAVRRGEHVHVHNVRSAVQGAVT
ncbi:MAG: UxaA family hydrolase [Planctomycetota bacterium]|jgi:altronate dehydratase small subunit